MDWSFLMIAVPVGAFILWRSQKQAEAAKVASARLTRDKLLYEHIKTGMREYDWRQREGRCEDLFSRTRRKAKDGELLFETAHLSAFHVNHGPEYRVGFYFKDINEFGLYGLFAGNGDETITSYYRTDRTFQKEEMLAPWYD
ncbi:hypothetical protein FXV83_35660 [Bradyrhizobium hipponense]|uniref:Uncharacterized protein n=1 Tax=Bradyrhizobium hipponense TaxID=2605638 RepID=A0A5S4YBY7_9BRAD|nr:hypothetical protein [Bradyrhizobium hipponense]TYO61956.1 hypothetical protein FXV83_35660 [Bradyrhizobium hipponense]